jgi:hypothetical protein
MLNTETRKRNQITRPVSDLTQSLTREERYARVSANRKKYARKQRFENFVLVPIAAVGIGILHIIALVILLTPLWIRLAGFGLIVFGIFDLIFNGLNAWAFAWIVLGIIIVNVFKFKIATKR